MGDRDIPKEIPAQQQGDKIIDKVLKENSGQVAGAKGTDKVAPGADNKVDNLPKVAVSELKGKAALAETVAQITPDFHNPKTIPQAEKALETKVATALEQAKQGDLKPAKSLSSAIDQSTKLTTVHMDNLNKQANSVRTAMDKAKVGSIDTNMA